ncbi:MAG TPA: DUF1232 domain-containing protein [Burkholderiaceae bacterium]|nr:DUF1232 domain-containing protein [Burkholderiaceae bacterium]
MTRRSSLRSRVAGLKTEVLALYFAARDPRTPRLARWWIVLVVAYALSPIDLIPDFIPVLGLLDDLVLVPIGIAIALKLVPPQVLAESRVRARERVGTVKHAGRVAAFVIAALWLAVVFAVVYWLWTWLSAA